MMQQSDKWDMEKTKDAPPNRERESERTVCECVRVCVSVCEREREIERGREIHCFLTYVFMYFYVGLKIHFY